MARRSRGTSSHLRRPTRPRRGSRAVLQRCRVLLRRDVKMAQYGEQPPTRNFIHCPPPPAPAPAPPAPPSPLRCNAVTTAPVPAFTALSAAAATVSLLPRPGPTIFQIFRRVKLPHGIATMRSIRASRAEIVSMPTCCKGGSSPSGGAEPEAPSDLDRGQPRSG